MDKKRIDRIVREEVADLLESRWGGSDWQRRRGTTLSRSEYFGGNLPGSDDEMRPRRRSPEHLKVDFLGGRFAGATRLVWPPKGSSVIKDEDVNRVNNNIMSVLQDEDMATNGVEALSGPRGKDGIRAVITVLRSEEPRMENKFICAIQDLVTGKQYGSNGPQETPVDAIRSAEAFWLPDSMASLEEPGPMGPLSESRWAKLSGLNEARGMYRDFTRYEMGLDRRPGRGGSRYRDPEGEDLPSGPDDPSYMTMSDKEFAASVERSRRILSGETEPGPRVKTDVRGPDLNLEYNGTLGPAAALQKIEARLSGPEGAEIRISSDFFAPGAALPGGRMGVRGDVEFLGGDEGYKASGHGVGGPGLGRRIYVGTGPTVEAAYMSMFQKVKEAYKYDAGTLRTTPSDVKVIQQRVPDPVVEPLSESRWAKIAGLMTEGKRSKVSPAKKGEAQKLFVDDEDGEPILYMGPAGMSHSAAMEAKGKLRKVTPGQALAAMKDDPDMAAEASGTDDRDEIMGHLRDMAEDRKEAGKLKRGARPMPEPADLDEADSPKKPERLGAPGAVRPPEKADPEKGPPSHKKLDRIKDLGPFERKKR